MTDKEPFLNHEIQDANGRVSTTNLDKLSISYLFMESWISFVNSHMVVRLLRSELIAY